MSMSAEITQTTNPSTSGLADPTGGSVVYERAADYSGDATYRNQLSPREKNFVVYVKNDAKRHEQVNNKRPWVNYFNLSEPPGSKTLRKVYRSSRYQVFSIDQT